MEQKKMDVLFKQAWWQSSTHYRGLDPTNGIGNSFMYY